MGKRYYRQTTIISLGLAAFLLGLVAARRVTFVSNDGLVLLVLCLTPLLFSRTKLSLLSIVLLGLGLGCWRGAHYTQQLLPYSDLAKQKITIHADVLGDAVYTDKSQLSFDVGQVQLVAPIDQKIPGNIKVKGYSESMVYRGDRVQVSAKLYPSRGSRQASMGFAKIIRLQKSDTLLQKVRRKFSSAIQSSLPEPHGSFALGILIGQRTSLPAEFEEQLSVVGLTHIVAVSGYNLTILIHAARRLSQRLSKYQTLCTMTGFVTVFVAITGSSASIVRATVVSGLSMWAWYYGRQFKPHLIILLSAGMTAGWAPTYIWSDIGWYLSFLAFIGVLIVAPIVQARYYTKAPKLVGQLLLETIAAQLMTLPLILYIFGRLSVISVLANMLVVPTVPFIMAASFLAGVTSMVATGLAGWFAVPTLFVMTYVVDLVRILSTVPGASTYAFMQAWQVAVVYGIVFFLLVILWRKAPKNGTIQGVKRPTLSEPVL